MAAEKYDSLKDKYQTHFAHTFAYEFSEADLKIIQTRINELRDFITSSDCFSQKHKERILKKLEGLQASLHQRMSSLDKLWALMGEAGVAIGKFGKDAKPFADIIRDILQVTWQSQARAEELSSVAPFPKLPPPEPNHESQQDSLTT